MQKTEHTAIIPYSASLAHYVKELIYEWLQKYFTVEPGDVVSLADPQKEIIEKGGYIFFATANDEVVGTASLLFISHGNYELGKMAVTGAAQGLGIGKRLLEHCLQFARNLHCRRLVLYSNTQLASAIHLYRKYGFREIALEPGHYERANIKMELYL